MRGLDKAAEREGGHLFLGMDAAVTDWQNGHAYGTLSMAHHITDTPLGELSMFADAYGGATMTGGKWRPEAKILTGAGLRW